MELMFERVAGLDVHRDTVMACVRSPRPSGKGRQSDTREFATTTGGLRVLRDWLASQQVTHVAMEATGVYWVGLRVVGDRLRVVARERCAYAQRPGPQD